VSNPSQAELEDRDPVGSEHSPYREVVYHPTWLAVLFVLTFVMIWGFFFALRVELAESAPSLAWAWDAIWIPLLLTGILVPALLGRFVVLVEQGAVVVRFGFVKIGEKKIPLHLIERAEPISYRPIRQFGGWGVRAGTYDGAKTAAYSLGGSTGTLLTLKAPIDTLFLRTDKILIGNRNHQRLADYLTRAVS
jgi:hypothetical protein